METGLPQVPLLDTLCGHLLSLTSPRYFIYLVALVTLKLFLYLAAQNGKIHLPNYSSPRFDDFD